MRCGGDAPLVGNAEAALRAQGAGLGEEGREIAVGVEGVDGCGCWGLRGEFFGGAQCGSGLPGSSAATGEPAPPPKPVGQTIREIRERAGVDPANISDNPSYNEIMLAMTKERFLDPDYYTRMQNEIGALQQERASIKAYITMQLQDIYVLQEQINVLMAARASMKLNEGGQGQHADRWREHADAHGPHGCPPGRGPRPAVVSSGF